MHRARTFDEDPVARLEQHVQARRDLLMIPPGVDAGVAHARGDGSGRGRLGVRAQQEQALDSERRREATRLAVGGFGRRAELAHVAQHSDLLAGAAPRSLENPLSIKHSVVVSRPELQAWLRNNPDVHMNPMGDGQTMASLLDPRVVPTRVSAGYLGDRTGIGTDTGSSPGLVADDSIALLRLHSGTDRRDFSLVENGSNTWRPRVPASGVIVLDGHLWIDRLEHPLVVVLSRSLTIVVNGETFHSGLLARDWSLFVQVALPLRFLMFRYLAEVNLEFESRPPASTPR